MKRRGKKSAKVRSNERTAEIGGWLLVIFILMFLDLIGRIAVLFSVFSILNVIALLLSLTIILLILYRKKTSPMKIIIGIWTLTLIDISVTVQNFLYRPILNTIDGAIYDFTIIIGLILSVALTTLISLYFIKSKRVKSTFVEK